ncbi:MAG: tRNA (adenosine(37)-N6)-threonylcarbamoyltransferase complex dimerization subunit type 1 TsaB [Termitinemataceae bacterium]|nr:MAG: tRNA (adenosine(37)-N6)-threonylcarbamoyltransferase complex dimerization subunit type 1 TsaB [Termitinemataceae bacterium]
MTILALDTATEFFEAALGTQNGNFSFELDVGMRHSELLLEAVDHLLKISGTAKEDIDLFACFRGPGSFTGLRIGFAAVKGLCLALSKSYISVPTLDCIGEPFSGFEGIVVPVLDARQRRFYSALYRGGKKISDYLDVCGEDLSAIIAQNSSENCDIMLCGNAAQIALPLIRQNMECRRVFADPLCETGHANLMLKYIKKSNTIKEGMDDFSSSPLYIRKSDAENQLRK